jgi:hypothetical protein
MSLSLQMLYRRNQFHPKPGEPEDWAMTHIFVSNEFGQISQNIGHAFSISRSKSAQ